MAYSKIFQCLAVTKSAFEMKHVIYFFRDSEYKIPVYKCGGPSDEQQIKLYCDEENAITIKSY